MRTRHTRAGAEAALACLVAQLDGRTDGLVVIGGLNPELLAPVQDAPHQGTADIDLVVQLGFVYDRDELDLGWLEAALDATGFVPVGEARAWQWVMTLDDTPVRIDLLTDVLDHRGQQLAVPGCARMTVQNVAGPAPALRNPVIRQLAVPSGEGLLTWVDVPFANLGGYLLAKAAAVLGRRADRDPYDLAFVLQHNTAGGPRAAARAVRGALPAGREQEFDGVFRAALSQLVDPRGRAARLFAEQRLADGDPLPVDVLAVDASAAARQCLAELDLSAVTAPPHSPGG